MPEMATKAGISHVCAATAIKYKTMYRGKFISYNKNIKNYIDSFKPKQVFYEKR